jgi:hypothetical protein
MKYNRIDIKWRLVSTSFKIYLDILSTSTSRSRSVITTLLIYFNQKQEWPVAAMFVNGSELNEQIL